LKRRRPRNGSHPLVRKQKLLRYLLVKGYEQDLRGTLVKWIGRINWDIVPTVLFRIFY
jgi:hypothetical protein